MIISRDEALKAVDDIFNYCEEIDYSLPENERSGYEMLPDINKIRKYIIENTKPRRECNQCQYYVGVRSVHGHAPCSFWGIGGVMWNDYCSRYKEEGEEE